MKTFTKTLLAAAVASASVGAVAADVTVKGFTKTDDQQAPWVSQQGVELGNTLIVHSGLVVTFEDDTLDAIPESAKRVLVEIDGASFALDADGIAKVGTGAAGDNVSFDTLEALAFASPDPDQLASGTAFDSGSAIELSDLKINLAEATSSTVKATVSIQRETSANVYTTIESETVTVAQVVSQIGLSPTAPNGTSDKANKKIDPTSRVTFTPTSVTDSFTVGVYDRAVQYATVDAVNNSNYTIEATADFSFLDADGDGNVDESVSVTATSGSVSFEDDFSGFTLTDSASEVDGDGTGFSNGLTFTFDQAREIPVLDVDATLSFSYKGTAPTTDTFSADYNIIDWQLNANQGSFKYMPYGDNISQILYVTNNEANDASIILTAYDNTGEKYGPVMLDVAAKGNAVTKITGQVEDALEAEGFSGQGQLKLILDVTSGDVEFYGAYNVGGTDRGYVPAK